MVRVKTIGIILGIFLGFIGKTQFSVLYSGVDKDLHCVQFTDQDTGYAGGIGGTLIKTTDGGRRWTSGNLKTAEDINDLCFISADIGFVVGENSTFLMTGNGGESWAPVENLKEADYNDIHFVDSLNGFAIGHSMGGGVFCKTIDGGKSWTTRMIDQDCSGNGITPGIDCDDIYLTSLSFLDAENGLVAGFTYSFTYGKHPFICKTNDGGLTFADISPQDQREDWYNGKEVVSISYINDHDACAVMNTGSGTDFMFISDYGVKSFEKVDLPSNFSSRGRFFTSQFLGRFIGYFAGIIDGRSQIIKTIDQGNTFMYLNPPTTNTIYASCFADQNNGYFVGEKGMIIHLSDRSNIVYNASDRHGEYDEDSPFTVATLKHKNKIMQVHIYNLRRNNPRNFSVSVFDSFGKPLAVKPRKVKIYKDEIRIRLKVEGMEPDTYFYTVTYSNRTLINGKLNLSSYAQIIQ
jgi:photosystem II stability/assembly factor-like uncharacterized protein